MPELWISERFVLKVGAVCRPFGVAMVVVPLFLIGCTAVSPWTAGTDRSSGAVKAAVGSGGPFRRIGVPIGIAGYDLPIFSGNSRRFIALNQQGANATVRVWDVSTLQPLCDPLADPGMTYGLTFDGRIAFTTDDESVRFWDVDSSKLICVTKVTSGELDDVAISPDGTEFLVIVKGEQGLEIWRVGGTRPRFAVKQDAVYAAFDRSSTRIVINAGPATHIISAETGKETCPRILAGKLTLPDLTTLFDSTGRSFLVQDEAAFRVVDTTTGKTRFYVAIDEFYGGSNEDEFVRWSSDTRKVVATSVARPQAARIYDASTGKLERTFGTDIVDCWVGPGARWAVGFSESNISKAFNVWDVKTGRLAQTLNCYNAVASPDCSTILTMRSDRLDAIWRMPRDCCSLNN
jgi:WD40 repeat protein